MARLRLDLDQRTFDALAMVAATELRPIPWQAEEILRRVLGTRPSESPPTTRVVDGFGHGGAVASMTDAPVAPEAA